LLATFHSFPVTPNVDPQLNPIQPHHRKNVPRTTKLIVLGILTQSKQLLPCLQLSTALQ